MARQLTDAEVKTEVAKIQNELGGILERVRRDPDVNAKEEIGKLVLLNVRILALTAEANTVARGVARVASIMGPSY